MAKYELDLNNIQFEEGGVIRESKKRSGPVASFRPKTTKVITDVPETQLALQAPRQTYGKSKIDRFTNLELDGVEDCTTFFFIYIKNCQQTILNKRV